MKKQPKSRGITINVLLISLSMILGVLIIAISFLTKNVNETTSSLAELMQESNEYQQAATKLQAGTSVLSETLSGFVQMPVIQKGPDAGTLNVGPLLAYAQELNVDRRPATIRAQFRTFGVSDEILSYIDTAAEYSQQMLDLQTHAISLIVSVYPLPDNPALDVIPRVELTAEERSMSADERIARARGILFDKSYTLLKSYVYTNIEQCHALLQAQFNAASAESRQHISALRNALWFSIFLIMAVLLATFLIFNRWIVQPLRRYSEDMLSDQKLERQGRIRELWSMVAVYNEVLDRRNKLESILRTAAETDSLTGLPNRYHYEQSILDLDPHDGSLAVLLFDVNFLKIVNDTKGHPEGDRLLRKSAGIIRECFGAEGRANCYRIGGDEFAAILRGCTEQEIKSRLEAFQKAQAREEISVSAGYAIGEMADENAFHQLMALADARMYEQKKQAHLRAPSGIRAV